MFHKIHTIKVKHLHRSLSVILILAMLIISFSGCSKSKSKNDLVDDTVDDISSHSPSTSSPSVSLKKDDVPLVYDDKAMPIYIDHMGADYDGISLVATSFAEDVKLVTGQHPEIITESDKLSGSVILAGSIGNNEIIDSLIADGKIDVSMIKDKWECYKIQVLDNPIDGVDRALVVVGSDKRGTIYGIYHISEMIGVSPWVYWGDVTPEKQDSLIFTKDELNTTSKEPSIKYRGIFLNDEYPSLGNWARKKFGGFNEKFYDNVFELILRLKGNYLWPAMWSNNFSEDGLSSKYANAELADAYGIVMGTSHHEPMFRAGVEWQRIYKNYGSSNTWDFRVNEKAITNFWEDGLKRNKDFESIITVGMRGEADSALHGTDEENIELLKKIIITQMELLKKYNLENSPLVLTLYKEVEKFWYGTAKTEGLRNWDVLDRVTIMLSEDNFGNVRTLPTADERDREAGWGMYYHFDYHGGPRSYEWVNTIPITKVWEQMSMAYDYGVREIWIVNVGDLKPMELPISYFLDLAYDFETWGTEGINKTDEYTKLWVKQQYGHIIDEDAIEGIAGVLNDYTRMNGKRKPEITYASTYSYVNFNEAQRVLEEAFEIERNAKIYYDIMPEEYKDSYYQLVYYPAVASANIKKMQIFAGLNDYYYKQKSVLANTYAALTQESIDADTELTFYYNMKMSGGKWEKMMSSAHIGYTTWNDEGWQYPSVNYVTPEPDYSMIVSVEGSNLAYPSGTADLPTFTNLNKEAYWITISNGGSVEFDYNVSTDADWIVVSKDQGNVLSGDVIEVHIDWDKITKSSNGVITITAESDKVEVNVNAQVIDTQGLDEMTFVEAHDYVSIEAEHFTSRESKAGVEWKVIDNYGRSLSSLKMFPTDVSFEKPEEAPYLEYTLYVDEDADYILTTYTAPTNNLSHTSRLKYGVQFDNNTPVIADILPPDFIAGDSNAWGNAVMANALIKSTPHRLTKGTHTLRFYGLDAGVVLQKLVLSKGPLPASYFGPEESYYVGKDIVQQPTICHKVPNYYTIPGTVTSDHLKLDGNLYLAPVVITSKGEYILTLKGTATQDSEIGVIVGNKILESLQWKAGETTVSSSKAIELLPGGSNLRIDIKTGDAVICEATLELPDTNVYYPVGITASTTLNGSNVNNVLDKVKSTTWQPDANDSKPWIEFEFDREYYFDHLVFKGSLDAVQGYDILISDSINNWTKVYSGTSIETGKDIYMQGTKAIKGKKLKVEFTKLDGILEISEIEPGPYINWAMEEGKATVKVSLESDIDKSTIIDGDRINPGWITQSNQTVTLDFGEERTIDTVTVIGIQESVKDGKPGVIPTAEMTSAFVQRQYTVSYKDSNNKWVTVADYITAPDGKETEPLRKVINKIPLGEEITTSSIKVDIGTSYWIRLIELEAVESIKVKPE
ncbi:MAG: hypothetical protein GX321_08710 [Clostridiales bacterium]|nr:hypothetical protein [Clostridiales bacterium]